MNFFPVGRINCYHYNLGEWPETKSKNIQADFEQIIEKRDLLTGFRFFYFQIISHDQTRRTR